MRLMLRLERLLFLFALSAALLMGIDPAIGQTPGSIADTGLQILQGLTPEQRNAISQQLGGLSGLGGIGGAQGAAGARPQPGTEEQQALMLQQQRDQLM